MLNCAGLFFFGILVRSAHQFFHVKNACILGGKDFVPSTEWSRPIRIFVFAKYQASHVSASLFLTRAKRNCPQMDSHAYAFTIGGSKDAQVFQEEVDSIARIYELRVRF